MLGPFQTTGLARRLIPCLDVSGGRVVKGVRFEHLRDAGDPVEQAARYDADGADELVFLDIGASHEARGTLSTLQRCATRRSSPASPSSSADSASAQQWTRSGTEVGCR